MIATLDPNPQVQARAAALQARLNAALSVASGLKKVSVSMTSFDPQLNKNLPNQDAAIAQFDQAVTAGISEFKTNMLQVRAKMPQPKPPVTPICAVWPGTPGGSVGV